MKIIKHFDKFTEEQATDLENKHKTYLKRRRREIVDNPEQVQIILNKMRNYDISKFSYINRPYDFCITPDKTFISYIEQLNKHISEKISTDMTFNFTYDVDNLNLIEFERGIPDLLQSIGFGYKLYCFIIDKIKNITSDWRASKKAIHVWRGLITDSRFYSLTSNQISCILSKDQSDEEIKLFLNGLKNHNSNVLSFEFDNLIFDDELEEKIKEIYGSLDTYKQKY